MLRSIAWTEGASYHPHQPQRIVDRRMDVPPRHRVTDAEKLEKGKEFMIGSKMETIVTTIHEDEENEYIGYKFRVAEMPKD